MLTVKQLYATYGTTTVLHDVNVEVNPGEIRAILGPNSAGKSTLLKSIAGLIRPAKGHIAWGDLDLTGLPAHEVARRGIVLVPERRRLFYDMTVYENLMLGSYSPRAKAKRQENLALIDELFPVLLRRRQQLVRTLSGGEQQMLAIARGLMGCPEILLLDEPSIALAPILVKELFQALETLRQRGLAVLLAEQNAKLALRASSYGYFLWRGRVVEAGESANITADEHALVELYHGRLAGS